MELPEAALTPLPLTPAGHYLVAARPAVTGKQGTRNVVLQPESWYAVQDAPSIRWRMPTWCGCWTMPM